MDDVLAGVPASMTSGSLEIREGEPRTVPLALADARFAVLALAQGRREDAAVVAALAEELRPRRLRAGENLCVPGQAPPGIWIIQDGLAEVTVGTGANRVVVQTLCRGDAFGIADLTSGRCLPYRSQATTYMSALLWPARSFFDHLERDPGLVRLVLDGLANRMVDAWVRLSAVLASSLEARAARMLLLEERDGVVAVSQATLASMIGASRPALNRVLRDFQRQRAIDLQYRRIQVLDRALLSGLTRVAAGPEPDDLVRGPRVRQLNHGR